MTANHAKFLAEALTQLLGSAESGNIAFVRCLPPDCLAELVTHVDFRVLNWDILVVTAVANSATRTITADQAVELRESKGKATLLLVNVDLAGAGMDGIYSAAKE